MPDGQRHIGPCRLVRQVNEFGQLATPPQMIPSVFCFRLHFAAEGGEVQTKAENTGRWIGIVLAANLEFLPGKLAGDRKLR